MNTKQVLEQLNEKYPGKQIIQKHDTEGEVRELLCEVDPSSEHPAYSLAVAIIDRSTPHKHLFTTEVYKILKGKLTLFLDGEQILLGQGDEFTIKPGVVHFAVGDETWVEVRSNPGWNPDDHIAVG